MKFALIELPGVVRIELQPRLDERGMFARAYCPEVFAAAGIDLTPVQMNLSRNTHAHTLRGMHFQPALFAEAKVVRAVVCSIYDVVIDLRLESPTYGRWAATTLTSAGGEALFVPEGLAHGFLTLEPNTDVLYQMGRMHVPGHARGVRWDELAFAVEWPAAPKVMDEKDRHWPAFEGILTLCA